MGSLETPSNEIWRNSFSAFLGLRTCSLESYKKVTVLTFCCVGLSPLRVERMLKLVQQPLKETSTRPNQRSTIGLPAACVRVRVHVSVCMWVGLGVGLWVGMCGVWVCLVCSVSMCVMCACTHVHYKGKPSFFRARVQIRA